MGATAGVAAILVLGGRRTASITGWLGVIGLLVLLVAAIWAIAVDPGRSFEALGEAFTSVFKRAPRTGAFTGAVAGEIAFAAGLWVLPTMAAGTGALGAGHSMSAAPTRRQVAAAILEPFALALVATVLVMAFAGTFGERAVNASRPLRDVRALVMPVETVAQRGELSRRYGGGRFLTIREGRPVSPDVSFMTERGMIRAAEFRLDGEPAEIRLQFDDEGRVFRLLVPTRPNVRPEAGLGDAIALDEHSELIDEVEVRGEMLPTGSQLVVASDKDDDVRPRLVLAALLALVAVMLAVWGFAIGRALPATLPLGARLGAGLLPASLSQECVAW